VVERRGADGPVVAPSRSNRLLRSLAVVVFCFSLDADLGFLIAGRLVKMKVPKILCMELNWWSIFSVQLCASCIGETSGAR
jgi:hypothetical protein